MQTSFTVQNLDPSTVAAVTTYFFTSTTGTWVNTITRTVQPNRHTIIDQRDANGGLGAYTAWQGSAIISSTTPIGAVVSEFSPQSSATLGQDFRFDTYNAMATAQAATAVFMPQLLKNITDDAQGRTYNSIIAIQNSSATASANVTLVYNELAPNMGAVFTKTNIIIPPSASVYIDQNADPALASESRYYGSGRIISNQPVVAIVNFNAPGSLLAYPGFTDLEASTRLYVPFLLKNVYDAVQDFTYGTGMNVMTVEPGPATVTVTYILADGSTIVKTKTANPTINFDQREPNELPGKSTAVASATITSNKRIIAMVNEVTNNHATRGLRSATYRAVTNGASRFYIPLQYKNYRDTGQGVTWGSGVSGQLIGDTTTTISITYYNYNGVTRTSSVIVNPAVRRVFVLDIRIDPNWADQSQVIASAVITSDNGQPFTVIANQVGSTTDTGDTLGCYAGVLGP